jgi:glycerate kinase
LSAKEVCQIIGDTLKKESHEFEIELIPMADGGEGSAEILAIQSQAEAVISSVHDPLMRKIQAQYFIKEKTAFIEMASASGLQLLKKQEQNVLKTTSFGTGELMKDAIKQGCENIILCIGGSATSDAGTGMAKALGFEFLDKNGKYFLPTAQNLGEIASIKLPKQNILKGINVNVLTDVNNPLTGKNGATYQYAIQKGALEKDLAFLDKGMKHLKKLIEAQFNFNIDQLAGAGASGGMGGGSTFFLNAKLHSGINYIADALGLDEKVKNADIVISGEGKLDEQSFKGKVVSGVLSSCQKNNKPLYLVVGFNSITSELPKEIKAVISLTDMVLNQKEAIKYALNYLEKSTQKLFEIYLL